MISHLIPQISTAQTFGVQYYWERVSHFELVLAALARRVTNGQGSAGALYLVVHGQDRNKVRFNQVVAQPLWLTSAPDERNYCSCGSGQPHSASAL
jgi:hypothetical protein